MIRDKANETQHSKSVIEVTPEMVRAGADILIEWDSDYCDWDDVSPSAAAEAVFRKMLSMSRKD